ncbi:MAG: nucleotide exchange factor GrpE [Clostridia bacterium]|nr:nucleotide exchange factor GrpE [Clostridia bacterium]
MNSIDNDENLSEEEIEESIEEVQRRESNEDEIAKKNIEKSEIENLKTQNDLLKQELADLNNKYLRLAAEYKNYQERSKKEKSNIRSYSLIEAVSAILPIIDDIERTLPSFAKAGEEYEKGLNMILKRTSEALKKLGVESFGEKGEEFDPSIHNASSKIESDENQDEDKETSTVISEVYQKGYKINEKLIRPAMVQVRD